MRTELIVEFASGKVRGMLEEGVAAFKGIPYGSEVSGAHRWRPADPARPWIGIRGALRYGPRAAQMEISDLGITSPEINTLLLEGAPPPEEWLAQSEDCLTLNLWSPSVGANRKCPVMVWLHGGGYHGETPPVWWFDGTNLARRGDVVVVTVRHRLGPFGYLHLANFPGSAGYEKSGNVGMLDLVLALRWVRENIGAFGGDAGNVTIFGESGGGGKVSVLMGMPAADGLYHRAIIQSGARPRAPTAGEGTETARVLVAELGIRDGDIDALVKTPAEAIIAAQARLAKRFRMPWSAVGLASFQPVVDGSVLPRSPFDPDAPAGSRSVPLMVGTCETEATFLASAVPGVFDLDEQRMQSLLTGLLPAAVDGVIPAYRRRFPKASPSELFFAIATDLMVGMDTLRVAERKSAQGGAPVYMYQLTYKTDCLGGKLRTPHTLDIPLVFNNDHAILGSRAERHRVAEQMAMSWAAFARTGDPNNPTIPQWPPYDPERRATLRFDVDSQLLEDPAGAEIRGCWRHA
jgi:para-nitrobenzyl esterase